MSDEAEMDLVMPFVVCTSRGGPYDDESFVAGVRFGRLDSDLTEARQICATRVAPAFPVPSALVPQLDLLAMSRGFQLVAGEELPGAWVPVTFTAETS